MINRRTANAIETIRDAFIAKPIPFNSPLILGMNFNRRNDLKILSDRNERITLVANPVSTNMFNREGTAIKVIMKSLDD